jgi:hypothetical protein
MSKDELISEILQVGFTGFVHLRKEVRDGKGRFMWTHPIVGHSDWFTTILVEDGKSLAIEMLKNPFGHSFDRAAVPELIDYMKANILNKLDETNA